MLFFCRVVGHSQITISERTANFNAKEALQMEPSGQTWPAIGGFLDVVISY